MWLATLLTALATGLARAERVTLVDAALSDAGILEGAIVYETQSTVRLLTGEGVVDLERARVLSVDREHQAPKRLQDKARRLREKAFREFRKQAKQLLRRYGKADEAERTAIEAELRALPEVSTVAPLGRALDHDRAPTRELAARLLGENQTRPAAVDELLKAAMTSKRSSLAELAHHTAATADATRTRTVYEAVAASRTKPERRVKALGFLGAMSDRNSVPGLILVLEYVQSDIRTALATAGGLRRVPVDLGSSTQAGTRVPIELPELQMVEVNTTVSVPTLRVIQKQAKQVLSQISGQDYGDDVAGWRAWWEREAE
jgi:HEAT repeat protein